jgi:murein DD-endopeptidase MepM/ murein hydrolase activator NlpD
MTGMSKLKTFGKWLGAVSLTLFQLYSVGVTSVYADPGYDDTNWWLNNCAAGNVTTQEQWDGCQAFYDYMSTQSDTLKNDIAQIESERESVGNNIAEYQTKINEYETKEQQLQASIDDLTAKIDAKQKEIDDKQADIDQTQADIEDKQKDVDAIGDKVKERMLIGQPTMRLNKTIDILMGASSFKTLLRIVNGLSDISEHDDRTMDSLKAAQAALREDKEKLETQKSELVAAQDELKQNQEDLKTQQEEVAALQYEAQLILVEYQKLDAKLKAEGEQKSSAIDDIRNKMANVQQSWSATVNGLVDANNGFITPVAPGSFNLSAGTWYYPGGVEHLGTDNAAAIGAPIRAVASGVIILGADGCPTYGGLGNMCAGYGGAGGGGNQVYEITAVNGSTYGIIYCHMMQGSVISTGTVVTQGQQIGRVGSSGNSSGGHTHVEVFYLGGADQFNNYAYNWDGSLNFNCGWSSYFGSTNRKCDQGYGAPCRLRPETVFPY